MKILNIGAVEERAGSAVLLHQPVVDAHQLGVVVKLQDELARMQLGFLAQKNLRAKMALEFFDGLADIWIKMNFRGKFRSSRAPRCQPFDLANC